MTDRIASDDAPDLPGNPRTWRDFRAALKKLMARAEMTAVAIERMSTDPAARKMGAESIADATVGRKIADKEEPVDARSVRTIVITCGLAASRRGEALADADVRLWLKARTGLAERPAASADARAADVQTADARAADGSPPDGNAPSEPQRPKTRRAWLVGALVVVLVGAGGAVAWNLTRPDQTQTAGGSSPPTPANGDDLVSGRPPCRNPPDKQAGTGLTIAAPTPGMTLTGDATDAHGTVDLAPGERPPWLMLYAIGECKFYLGTPVTVSGNTWSGTLYADPEQLGSFVAYVVVVDADTDRRLHEIAAASRSPFIVRLPPGARVVHVTVRCCG